MSGPGGGSVIAGLTQPADNPPAVAFTRPRPPQKQPTGDADGHKPNEPKPDNSTAAEEELGKELPFIGNALAGYIRSSWSRNKRARDLIENRLLACLRARRGVYADFETAGMWSQGAGEALYLPYAAAKMRAAEAALRDLLLPDGERPWGLDPSPLPDLPPDIEAPIVAKAAGMAKQQMMQLAQAQAGRVIDISEMQGIANKIKEQLRDQVETAARKEAKERSVRMEAQIELDMQRGGYYKSISDYIQHFCTYPTAVLKGPFLTRDKRMQWKRDLSPDIVSDPQLTWVAVNPFDCYPAPEAETCQDGDFIERIRLSRTDLFGFIGVPGYNEAAIRNVLAFHATGALRAWLWSDAERRMLEGGTHDVWIPDYLVDALHYWGSVEGRTLIEYGIKEGVDDPLAYYEVDAVLIGSEVIRCEINDDPLGRRPYFNASYDAVPGAFWGNAIYELMRDCQAMINSSFRALNANLALASGPIMVADMGRMAVGSDPKSLKPLDVIQADSSRSPGSTGNPVYFLQADSRSQELLGIISTFEQKADDLTGIPKYTEGAAQAQGAGATFGGLNMLMQQAAKGFRRAVAHIDLNVIAKTVEATYVHEMLNNADDTLKGDCTITARGAAAVLIKEHLQQTRSQFLGMVLQSPTLQSLLGPRRIAALTRAVSSVLEMDTDDIVPTDQELETELQQKQQAPPQPTPDAQLHAQTEEHRIASKESMERAKLKAKLAAEGLIHPDSAGGAEAVAQALTPQRGLGLQSPPQPQAGPGPQGVPNAAQTRP